MLHQQEKVVRNGLEVQISFLLLRPVSGGCSGDAPLKGGKSFAGVLVVREEHLTFAALFEGSSLRLID